MNHRGFRRMNLHHIRSLYFSHFLCNIFLLNRLVNGHNYVQHASIMQSILLWTLSIIQWNTLDYYHDTVISNTSRFQKNVKWKLRSGYRCLLNHSLCSWWCWWFPTLLSSRVEHGGAHRLKPDVRKCKFDCWKKATCQFVFKPYL